MSSPVGIYAPFPLLKSKQAMAINDVKALLNLTLYHRWALSLRTPDRRIIRGAMDAPSLQGLVGHKIIALIPALHPSILTQVTIHAVEVGGIWIEHDPMTQKIMRDMKQAVSEKTVVLFVPYSGIDYVVGWIEKTSLSESAFGG